MLGVYQPWQPAKGKFSSAHKGFGKGNGKVKGKGKGKRNGKGYR